MSLDKLREENWITTQKHGLTVIETRAEVYAEFLHDGDFEEWQHYCYTDELPFDKLINIEREIMRWNWIKCRFTEYYSPEWIRVNKNIMNAYAHIHLLEGIRDKTTSLYNKNGGNQILNIF